MKKLVIVLGFLLGCVSVSSAHFEHNEGFGVSFSVFYSSLGSYGEWIPVEGGVYGWRPIGVAVGWRPYMYGRWAWTVDGWYWVSDEPWGWAVFHYGRWYYDDYYGWIWIPGYDWAPAWVEWRFGGPYVGWAPLSPYAVFQIGIGIHYARRWETPYSYWNFVDCRYVTSPSLHRFIYRPQHNTRYFGRTRSAGNVRYDNGRVITRGPEREYIQERGNIRIVQSELVDARDRGRERVVRDGGRERIEVYRPKIEAQTRDEAAERPARIREESRRIAIDTRQTDVGVRQAGRVRGEVTTQREPEAQQKVERRIERVPTPAQSGPAPRIEKRDDQPQAPSVERGVRSVPAPRVGKDASQRPEPKRESAPQPRIQREQVQKERGRTENPERTVRRPEVKQNERPAGVQRGSGRSESAPRGERRGREK
jgi:hypothetical protein